MYGMDRFHLNDRDRLFFFFILSIIPLIFVFKKFYKTNECSYMMEDRGGGKKRNVKGKILIRTKSSVSL